MTDNDTLAYKNIKHFGKLSTCYQYLTDIDSESCSDRLCLECGNDHSFRGNIKDAITFIDLLPEIFNAMSSIPKADNGTLTDLLCRAANIQKLTKVEQVNVENEWTEFLSLCLGIVVDYKGGC
jgi:hypothetical protein